jgi:hypothetical protein
LVGQTIGLRRLPARDGWQTTKNDGLPHKVDSIGGQTIAFRGLPRARSATQRTVYEPEAADFASSRSAAIRFCSVRKLIPSISAASLRLPRTCSRVSLM